MIRVRFNFRQTVDSGIPRTHCDLRMFETDADAINFALTESDSVVEELCEPREDFGADI